MGRACSADRIFLSAILLPRLRAFSVALVVFCSVGRIGPSPPNRPIRGGAFTADCRDDADGIGNLFREPTSFGSSRLLRSRRRSHGTPLPIQAFAKDPHLTQLKLHPSVPEMALLEMLSEVGLQQGIEEARNITEGARALPRSSRRRISL